MRLSNALSEPTNIVAPVILVPAAWNERHQKWFQPMMTSSAGIEYDA